MVQGKTKGLQSKAANSRHAAKAAANMKKGKRAIAPKKPVLMKQAAMHQVRHFNMGGCLTSRKQILIVVFLFRPRSAATNSQDKQVYRTTDGVCGVVWEANDCEEHDA